MNIFDLDQPNNKIILKNQKVKYKNREIDNFYSNLKTHWFNQKFEILLPISGTTNDDPIEKLKKTKGSLLSKKSLSGKLLVESEFTLLFQQHNETTRPIIEEDDEIEQQQQQQQQVQENKGEDEMEDDGNENENENDNGDGNGDNNQTDENIQNMNENQEDLKKDDKNKNRNRNRNKNRNKNNNLNNDKSSFYKIETTLDLILSQEFLNKYIRVGGFHALSQFNFIDSGNVFAILPNGKIILNVNKDTYQDLGLVGKASVFRTSERYVITLDSHSKELSSNSKYYNRLMWVLKDRLSSITLICYFQKDYNKESKESSTIHPIKFPKGVKVKRMFNTAIQTIEKHRIPTLETINQYLDIDLTQKNQQILSNASASKESKLLLSDFVNEFIEILGLISTESGEIFNLENDYQLSNSLLSSTTLPTEIFKASLSGFVSNSFIIETISKIKTLIKNGTIQYGCLIIHGFADTPVSWGSIEHNYLFGGENDQCIIILPNNQYLNLNLVGTLDYYC